MLKKTHCVCKVILMLMIVLSGVWYYSVPCVKAYNDGVEDGSGDGWYKSEDGTYELQYANINYKECEIVGFSIEDEGTLLNIPSEIEGKKVTAIKAGLFSGAGIKSITIPDTVTSIEYSTFLNCSNLEIVNIPETVTSIGAKAFAGTKWLENKQKEKQLVILNNILVDATACEGAVTIPSNITAICDEAFEMVSYEGDNYAELENTGLTSVTFNDGLKVIGRDAFKGCTSLTAVSIPESVTEINSGAFAGCVNLSSVSLSNSITNISADAFAETEWWAEKKKASSNGLIIEKYILFDGSSASGDITIPEEVTVIGAGAFSRGKVSSVTIAGDVTAIPEFTFFMCDQLTNVILPESLISIEKDAFYGCKALTGITIPAAVTDIGDGAFDGTKWLEELSSTGKPVVVNSILIDGKNCSGSVVIPEGVTAINNAVFSGNSEMTSLVIPDSVTEIGDGAFSHTAITEITIPDSVNYIGDEAFYGCKNLKRVKLPDGITDIESYMFWYCSSLEQITIPKSATNIGEGAFGACGNLKDLVIPNGVKSIGRSAFVYCDNLKHITIPPSVTYMGEIFLPEDITTDEEEIYYEKLGYDKIPDDVTLYAEAGSYAETWIREHKIHVKGSILTNESAEYKVVSDNVNEPTVEYSDTKDKQLVKITMPDSITIDGITYQVVRVGEYAFAEVSGLEEVVLSKEVKKVDEYAFYSNRAQEEKVKEKKLRITIPDGMDVTDVGIEKVQNIYNLTIYVPKESTAEVYLTGIEGVKLEIRTYSANGEDDGVQSAQNEAEQTQNEAEQTQNEASQTKNEAEQTQNEASQTKNGAEQTQNEAGQTKNGAEQAQSGQIKSGNLEGTVSQAEVGSIHNLGSLMYKVTSEKTVTVTGSKGKNLKKVSVPAKVTIEGKSYMVTAVGKGAFKKCSKLINVTIGKNVKNIGNEAFANCTKLEKVTVGKNVTTIGAKVFADDKKLKRLILKGAKINKVGKKTLSGVPKKVRITAPKKAVTKYTKLLKGAK